MPLKEAVQCLENKFKDLVRNTFERLKQAKVCLEEFYAKVSNMGVSLRHVAGIYFEESFGKVIATASLAFFWGKLNRFWDFFNYELFLHVVQTMFTDTHDPLRCAVDSYVQEIETFCTATIVSDFFHVWPFSIDKPQEKDIVEFKQTVVKVNKQWEDCTLRDVKDISRIFAQSFFLPREFLLLAGEGKSSVSLLWLVPPSLARTVEEEVAQMNEFLSGNGFLSVIVNNCQVYPLTPMKQCSLQLRRKYERFTACSEFKKSDKKLLMPFKLALITKQKISELFIDKIFTSNFARRQRRHNV